MSTGDPITKVTQLIERPDGSEIRIVATAYFGAGLHRSIGVDVFRRAIAGDDWVLLSDRPHPDWRAMSVDDYINNGRSEVRQAVSWGEIFKVTSLIGKPMSCLN